MRTFPLLFPACALAVLPAALLAPRPAGADLTVLRAVRREVNTFADRRLRYAGIEQIRIQNRRVRISNVTLGQALIIRLDDRKVIRLDLLGKAASELTFDQLAARRAAALQGVREAWERVRDTPEAARLSVVLAGYGMFLDGPPKVDRQATGEKALIAGRDAARVRISLNGQPWADCWAPDGPEEGLRYYEALAAIQAAPAEAVEALRQNGAFPLREDARYALFLDRVHVEAEASSVSADPVPASEFEIPAGFRKTEFEDLPEEDAQEVKVEPPKEK